MGITLGPTVWPSTYQWGTQPNQALSCYKRIWASLMATEISLRTKNLWQYDNQIYLVWQVNIVMNLKPACKCSKRFSVEVFNSSIDCLTSVSFLSHSSSYCTSLSTSAVRGSFNNLSMDPCHSTFFARLIWPAILTRATLISCKRDRNWKSSVISICWFTCPYTEFR